MGVPTDLGALGHALVGKKPAARLRLGRRRLRDQHVRASISWRTVFQCGARQRPQLLPVGADGVLRVLDLGALRRDVPPVPQRLVHDQLRRDHAGEVFHRLGATIRDNGARGRGRTLRELAALPMDPIGGLNRLIRGQWKARGPNPSEHDPGNYVLRVGAGARFAKGLIADSGITSMGALFVDLLYGDPFAQEYKNPFDVFGVRLILSSHGGFNALRASGRLYGANLNSPTRTARHVLAVNQLV